MNRHEHGHFSWVDLQATDIEKQSTFYEQLFGWTHEDVPTFPGGPPYRMLRKDGKLVAGAGPMPPDMPPGMPSMWNAYISVDDAEAAIAKAESLGGTVMMPLMDVEEFGRMVGVADPTGGPLFFWQPMGHTGAELYEAHGSVIWNDLNTRDMAAAADYYEALLGWKVDRSSDDDNYWPIGIGDDHEGGIMRMGEQFPPEVPSHWLTYFGADDARAITERAKELGGRAEMEPMEIPEVCIFCVLSDPEGAVFAVMQMEPMG